MAIGTHGVKKAACNLMRVTCGGSAVHHCTNCDRPEIDLVQSASRGLVRDLFAKLHLGGSVTGS
jgi:hypothetical protein